jgi:hypothetical protein
MRSDEKRSIVLKKEKEGRGQDACSEREGRERQRCDLTAKHG